MGLLDDAIREHLDLKRRRGADPAEVERDEREALGPVRRAPESPLDSDADDDQGSFAYDQEQEEPSWSHDPFEDEPASDSADADRSPEFLEDVPSSHRRSASDDQALDDEPFADEEPFADDADEYESDRGHADPESHPGTPAPHRAGGEETVEYDVEEALDSERHGHEHGQEPPAGEEDVLEETPEFLQDTPDHDRLWFEQRPPKDFDFDG